MAEAIASADLDKLLAHIDGTIVEWKEMFDGWPGNIELALIDAVLSIQARYGNDPTTGIRGSLLRYRDVSGRESWDDLEVLAGMDPGQLMEVLANRQKTGGVTKAEAIVNAAKRFVAVGVVHSTDVQPGSVAQRDAYCGTKGLGPITWEYFLMLLGNDGVKPDVLVSRFVEEALGRSVDYTEVMRLVREAATRLQKPVGALDHSIWNYVSRRPRRAPSPAD
ncbi:hypothetical protein [Mycobacterium sp. DL592]|uniref:hypothetical protein n=1 Tax=Mycobacterium sp. DL592 TaxID=2675524 RepID=UPI00141FF6F1|nr:hypothetical protein [Mycobacterium sp. DL592]